MASLLSLGLIFICECAERLPQKQKETVAGCLHALVAICLLWLLLAMAGADFYGGNFF